MQASGFQEALEKISAADRRYHPDAYAFLQDALVGTLKRRKKNRKDASAHVTAVELLDGFRFHALQEYGPMALTVLGYWGVHSCEDVGNMVFNLVNAEVFGKTEEDSPENFRDVYDFHEVFVKPFLPDPENLSGNASGAVGSKE